MNASLENQKKKSEKAGINIKKKRFFKKFLLARAVLIISILFWSFMPPPKTPTLNGKPPTPLPPLNKKKIPTLFPTLTREPTKKTMVLLLKISLSLLYSLSYSLSLLLSLYNILLFVMNISISEHFAYLLWATNLA